jgi:hypothetical protein
MRIATFAVVGACLLISACSKINQENYAQLAAGMGQDEVEALLGKPSECSGALGMTSCTWGDQDRFISVQYASGRVLMFSGKGLK